MVTTDDLVYCRFCGCAWRELPGWPLSRHETKCAYAIVCPYEPCQAAVGEHCVYPGGQTKQAPHGAREKLAREFPVAPLTPPVSAVAESEAGFVERLAEAGSDPRLSDAEVGRLVRDRWPRVTAEQAGQ